MSSLANKLILSAFAVVANSQGYYYYQDNTAVTVIGSIVGIVLFVTAIITIVFCVRNRQERQRR